MSSSEVILSPQDQLYLKIIEDLHKDWTPHPGQVRVGAPLLKNEIEVLFIQCGRKWGKTEFAAYLLWRHALLNPGSACYYVTPELSHGREIIWANQRLQRFGDKEYVKGTLNQEMRLNFKNGSFIKVFGSENWAAANGLTPDFVVYDEFKIFHPHFHTEMNPNRLARGAKLVIIGTPPKQGDRNRNQYLTFAKECQKNNDSLWFRRPSWDNPYLPKGHLEKERQLLFDRSDHEIWYREYEAKYVVGGSAAIFPMFDDKKFVRPHAQIYAEIKRDLNKLDWFCIADPGSTTCFAVLFGCINPFTKKLYLLDEIYEREQMNTSVRNIYPKIDYKMNEFYPNSDVGEDWCKVYDEAAAWFSTEVLQQYGVYFMPTQKFLNNKDNGLSLIKDQMLYNLITISDRCKHLVSEIEGYARDDKGNIIKKDDHLIDALRYLNASANYSMVEVLETLRSNNNDNRRFYKIEDDMDALEAETDWTSTFFKDF